MSTPFGIRIYLLLITGWDDSDLSVWKDLVKGMMIRVSIKEDGESGKLAQAGGPIVLCTSCIL
jgi:hypothetical protein